MQILLPIRLDRWQNPIATLLREVAVRTPSIDFSSFSGPVTREDADRAVSLWERSNIHRIRLGTVATHRYDIVQHASATSSNLALARLAQLRSFGKALRIYVANIQPDPSDRFHAQYVRAVAAADVVVAVSDVVARDVEESFGRMVHSIIPNGVDVDYFRPPETYGPAERPTVAFIGVVGERKRPDFFLEIASRLPDLDFVMAGPVRDPWGEEISRRARGMANVRYLGSVSRAEVRALLRTASALLFPSKREGLPLTVLEAMAVGVPVLARPVSSLPEVIEDAETGWLLPIRSPESWIARLKEIVAWDTVQRADFAKRARGAVEARYSWSRVAASYQKLYEGLL